MKRSFSSNFMLGLIEIIVCDVKSTALHSRFLVFFFFFGFLCSCWLLLVLSGFQLEGLYEGREKGMGLMWLSVMCLLSLVKFGGICVFNCRRTFHFIFVQVKKGEIRPPKLKTEDPNKSYVQRPVKRG